MIRLAAVVAAHQLLMLLLLPALPARAAARRVAVVAAADEPLRGALAGKLGGQGRMMLTFEAADLSDPIRRGELLAKLQNADLVVPVGDAATSLVLQEIEDVPVYFVGAAVVPGRRLSAPGVSGLLAYDPAALVGAAAAVFKGKLGVAYTPGYEPVVAAVRDAAAAQGVALEERKVETPRGIPEAVGGLLSRCRAVLLLGDPILARGAGFEFAAERSLSVRVPLVSVDGWQVRRGAFLGSSPDADALASAAAGQMGALSAGQKAPGPRVRMASASAIVVSEALPRRWGVKVPEGWRPVQ